MLGIQIVLTDLTHCIIIIIIISVITTYVGSSVKGLGPGLYFCQIKRISELITMLYMNFQDFSRTTGKQEPPSGLASQQLSRLPSDEHICLSPPWNEEDDGPVRVGTPSLILFLVYFILY